MNTAVIVWSRSPLLLSVGMLVIPPSGGLSGQDHQPGAPDSVVYQARLQQARESYTAKNYERSAALSQTLAENNPRDGENWLRLARCRHQLKEYRAAIEAFRRASELGFGRLQEIDVDIARAYAHLGEKDQALKWLGKALNEHRFEFRPDLQRDEAFRHFHSDPKFRELAGLLPQRGFTRDEGWRYDLDYLVAEIQRLNATYSRQPLPQPVRQAADRLREQIPALTMSGLRWRCSACSPCWAVAITA
jgi:tetratricopeptide (TPR) repeat protein